MLLAFDILAQQILWSVVCLVTTPLITLLVLFFFRVFSRYTIGQKALAYSVIFFMTFGLTLIILRFVSEKAYLILLILSGVTLVVLGIIALIRLQHRRDGGID